MSWIDPSSRWAEPPEKFCSFIGGALAAGGSILGGILGSDASSAAAKAQLQASQQAIAFQEAVAQAIQGQLSPFYNFGVNGQNTLSDFLGFTRDPANPGITGQLTASPAGAFGANLGKPPTYQAPSIQQFQASPGYQYQLQQTSDVIQNSGAAKTGAVSGNMLQALQQNAAGLSNQDWYNFLGQNWQQFNQQYNNYWNQYGANRNLQQDIFNRLLPVAQIGQSSAAQQAGPGVALANNIGGNIIGGGNATAAGIVGSSNALAGGFNSALTNFNTFAGGGGNSGISNALNFLFGGGGAGTAGSLAGTAAAQGY